MIERLLRAFRYQSTRPGRGMKPLPEYVIEPLAEFLIRPTDLRIEALETAIRDHVSMADELLGKGEHAGCYMEKRRFEALRKVLG